MTKKNDYVDIDINHHGGNKQSNAANVLMAPHKSLWRSRVLAFIKYREESGQGTTLKDVCRAFNKDKSEVSPRLTELKKDDEIEETGQKRERCAVYRTYGHKDQFETEFQFFTY